MPYKMVTDVGKTCGRLAGAALEHRELILDSLFKKFGHKLDSPEELEGVRKLLTLIGEDLYERHDDLEKAENRLRSEIREDRKDRGVRNFATVELRELLFQLRDILDLVFGAGSAEDIFQEDTDEIPEDGEPLVRLARRLRADLTDDEFTLPEVQLDLGIDLGDFVKRFDPHLADYERVRRSLHRGIHGSTTALTVKEGHLGGEEKEVVLAGQLLEAITAYSGQEAVAKRIRISRHRSRQKGNGDSEPSEAQGAGAEAQADGSENAPSEAAGPETAGAGAGSPAAGSPPADADAAAPATPPASGPPGRTPPAEGAEADGRG